MSKRQAKLQCSTITEAHAVANVLGSMGSDHSSDVVRRTAKLAEELLIIAAHNHVRSGDGTDQCRKCGHDLRHPVHFTENIIAHHQRGADIFRTMGETA